MTSSNPSFRRRRSARGMTLIEVLAAVLIMTVGMLGLVTLMARASQMTVATDDSQRAAMLANEMANEMWLLNTATPGTLAAWQARVAAQTAGGLPGGQVAVATPAPNLVRITITWQPPSGGARQYVTDVRLN